MKQNAAATYFAGFLMASVMWLGLAPAFAQDFPSRPVKLIVAGPPAGATDYIARLIAQKLSEQWGQPVAVENIAGASGTIGSRALKNATPDGHTIGLGHLGTHGIVPNLHNPPPYDPLRDFAPVNYLGNAWDILVVPPRVPAKSVPELMSMARERPDSLTYGSIGIGQPAHFLGFLLTRSAGVKIVHVPYKGSAPAVTDLLAERISMMFASAGAIVPYLKDRRLRALAITASKRSPLLPDVPTFKEIGMPELELLTWLGVFAPAKTPQPVVEKISSDVSRVLAIPDIRAKLAAQFFDPLGSTPEQFAAFLEKEVARWKVIVKDSGVRAE
jgi:tripartite-type tricarboxylate transporter receptor subunit TctC